MVWLRTAGDKLVPLGANEKGAGYFARVLDN
jgi:hypothetical protein